MERTNMVGRDHGDSSKDVQSIDGEVLEHEDVFEDVSVLTVSMIALVRRKD